MSPTPTNSLLLIIIVIGLIIGSVVPTTLRSEELVLSFNAVAGTYYVINRTDVLPFYYDPITRTELSIM
jgi:hypothetical protein